MTYSPPKSDVGQSYRPDIDGLRAVAILSIVLFHAFPSRLSGGFVGVDIFFVISGFLISGIIYKELRNDNFNLARFYAHRIKRIFPALIIVLSTTYIAGWFLLLPAEFKQLGKHITGGAGFIQNIILWQESGYFDGASELKPLLHLWSLAVEEQFYLLYPLIILMAWRFGIKIIYAIALAGLISFGLNIYHIDKNSVETFYFAQTRLWELLFGSALAYFQQFKFGKTNKFSCLSYPINNIVQHALPKYREKIDRNEIISMAGAIFIIISVIATNKSMAFPGWWALAPTSGATLIILAGPEAWLNRNILANRLMIFFGLISYPLYLWHWPLLSFSQIMASTTPSRTMRITIIILSIALASITYQFIEKPIRFGKKTPVKTIILATSMLIVGSIGFYTYIQNGFITRYPEYIQAIIKPAFRTETEFRPHRCFLYDSDPISSFSKCDDNISPRKKTIFIWGDSHAAHLFEGYHHEFGQKYNIVQRTSAGCPPIMDKNLNTTSHCKSVNNYVFDFILKTKPDRVVLSALWVQHDWKEIDATVEKLKASGIKNIDLIGPDPWWMGGLQRQLYISYTTSKDHTIPTRMATGLNDVPPQINPLMKAYAAEHNINYISPYNIMCNSKGCITRIGNGIDGLVSLDSGHLTPQASVYLVSKFPKI